MTFPRKFINPRNNECTLKIGVTSYSSMTSRICSIGIARLMFSIEKQRNCLEVLLCISVSTELTSNSPCSFFNVCSSILSSTFFDMYSGENIVKSLN